MKIIITESQTKRLIEDINEQKLWDRVKSSAQNLGSKIQTGVNKINDKFQSGLDQVTNKVEKAQQPVSQTYEQIRAEWMKVNSDMSNMKGFGEGTSKDESLAKQQAEMNGRLAIMKKMGKNNVTISAYAIDEKLFKDSDGTFHNLVIMEKN
jgi:hypothetical protein